MTTLYDASEAEGDIDIRMILGRKNMTRQYSHRDQGVGEFK